MPEDYIGAICLAAAALLLPAASIAWLVSVRLRRLHGLPHGRVISSDTGARELPARHLYSARYGLSGKPDYLVATRHGLVPVEVKPERTDTEPRESHLLQVLAYCLLLDEEEGKPPPYGLLRYRTETFKVDYNSRTRAHLIGVIEEMRRASGQDEIHRSHNQPARCLRCGYRGVCEESLWPE